MIDWQEAVAFLLGSGLTLGALMLGRWIVGRWNALWPGKGMPVQSNGNLPPRHQRALRARRRIERQRRRAVTARWDAAGPPTSETHHAEPRVSPSDQRGLDSMASRSISVTEVYPARADAENADQELVRHRTRPIEPAILRCVRRTGEVRILRIEISQLLDQRHLPDLITPMHVRLREGNVSVSVENIGRGVRLDELPLGKCHLPLRSGATVFNGDWAVTRHEETPATVLGWKLVRPAMEGPALRTFHRPDCLAVGRLTGPREVRAAAYCYSPDGVFPTEDALSLARSYTAEVGRSSDAWDLTLLGFTTRGRLAVAGAFDLVISAQTGASTEEWSQAEAVRPDALGAGDRIWLTPREAGPERQRFSALYEVIENVAPATRPDPWWGEERELGRRQS